MVAISALWMVTGLINTFIKLGASLGLTGLLHSSVSNLAVRIKSCAHNYHQDFTSPQRSLLRRYQFCCANKSSLVGIFAESALKSTAWEVYHIVLIISLSDKNWATIHWHQAPCKMALSNSLSSHRTAFCIPYIFEF
jgi:hypothetical protein